MSHHEKSRPPIDVPFEEDARATSDRMLALVDRLRDLEQQKRQHPIGSDPFLALAAEAEQLSRLIFRWSQMQGALAEESPRRSDASQAIRDVQPRPIHRLLADWREAELRLLGATPGSSEAEAATDQVEALREEYRRIEQDQRRAEGDDGGGEARAAR
jgi:hypothetical protein